MKTLLLLMLDGTKVSLEVFFLTLLFSLPLGLIVAFGRMSRHVVINAPVKFFMLIIDEIPYDSVFCEFCGRKQNKKKNESAWLDILIILGVSVFLLILLMVIV